MFYKNQNLVTLLELTEAFHEIRQLTVAKRVTIYQGKEGKNERQLVSLFF